MKAYARLFLLFFIIVVLSAVIVIPTSASSAPVLYVSSNGTGDGRSPNAPLGNYEGYVPDASSYCNKNAMVRAMYELQITGGTIVVVGPTYLDTASYNTGEANVDPAEIEVPLNTGVTGDNFIERDDRPTIYITSVYGGVDYRTQGAKLILDHAECCTANLRMRNPAVWKDLNIEYRYDPDYVSSYNNGRNGIVAPFMIECDYMKTVFDTGITCTSWNVKTNSQGDIYPMIIGGHRRNAEDLGTDVTVRSGTWSYVSAAGYGHYTNLTGTVGGDANLKVEGGKIGTILGTGSILRAYGTVKGKVNITVTGGEIGDVYLSNGEYYFGPELNFISNNATITGKIYHSPLVGEIIPSVCIYVDGVPISVPAVKPETQIPQTKPPVTTNVPETTAPETTKQTLDIICGHMTAPRQTEGPTEIVTDEDVVRENDGQGRLSTVAVILAISAALVLITSVTLIVLTKTGKIKW